MEKVKREVEDKEKAKKAAEEQAKKAAEEQAKKAAEKAKKAAEEQAKKALKEKAAEEQAKKAAEEQAKKAAEKAKKAAEQAKREAEEQAKKALKEKVKKAAESLAGLSETRAGDSASPNAATTSEAVTGAATGWWYLFLMLRGVAALWLVTAVFSFVSDAGLLGGELKRGYADKCNQLRNVFVWPTDQAEIMAFTALFMVFVGINLAAHLLLTSHLPLLLSPGATCWADILLRAAAWLVLWKWGSSGNRFDKLLVGSQFVCLALLLP